MRLLSATFITVLVVCLSASVDAQIDVTWTGRVVDEDGRPVAGARVHFVPDGATLQAAGYDVPRDIWFYGIGIMPPVFLEEPPMADLVQAVTDDDGRFVIDGPWSEMPSGGRLFRDGPPKPQLLITRDSHATCTVALGTDPQGRPPIADVGSITLAPGAVVRGRAVDTAGRPVARVRVRALDSRMHVQHADVNEYVTEVDGLFILKGISRRTQPEYKTFAIELLHEQSVIRFVDVPIGQGDVDLGDVVLEAGASIEGFVVDAAGSPVPGARIAPAYLRDHYGLGCLMWRIPVTDDSVAWRAMASLIPDRSVVADSHGFFRLTDIGEPNVSLAVLADGFDPTVLSEIPAGSRTVRAVLEAEAVWSVEVLARSDGQPVEGATVRAWRLRRSGAWGEIIKEVFPDLYLSGRGDGFMASEYESLPLDVQDVGVGQYLVRRAGRQETQLVITAPGYVGCLTRVRGLESGERGRTVVQLDPGAVIEGRVQSSNGPVAHPRVQLGLLEYWTETRADEQGVFRFENVPAGEWELVTGSWHSGEGRATVTVPEGGPTLRVTLVVD